jgi:3-hydroxyacyl-CoA dehydrogenase/enoyl-CoA hydratase/3-hydroxybutyryl-CoA epimerase
MENIFSGKAWKLYKDNEVGVLSFDLEGDKVNKLGEIPLLELEGCLDKVSEDPEIKALLINSAKKGSFIVGADINVIKSLTDKSQAEEASALGQRIFSKLEDMKIPTLAAIDGPCMGGGTELSLACKYRVCSDSDKTQIGLPEVKLGLLPGWGGTYRMPKQVGWMNAMDICLSGKAIRPNKAPKIGLVDAVLPAAIFEEKSLEIARGLSAGKKVPGKKPRKSSFVETLLTKNPLGKSFFFKKAKEGVMKATRGHYPAPIKSLELMKTKHGLSRDEYMKHEAAAFADLWESSESKNLVNLFLLMEAAKREIGADISKEEAKALAPVSNLAVLGAGVMGGGIGAQSIMNNIPTTMKDLNYDAIQKGLQHAASVIGKKVKRKRYTNTEGKQVMAKLRGQLDYEGFKGKDLVIEAIVENMDIKKSAFAELEEHVSDHTIVASNTSSLRITEMAKAFKNLNALLACIFSTPLRKCPSLKSSLTQGQTQKSRPGPWRIQKPLVKHPL